MNNLIEIPSAVRFNNKIYPFPDGGYAEVSRTFTDVRDQTGATSSDPRCGPVMPQCDLLDNKGNVVAHVSYNGRVWAGNRKGWQTGAAPLFDPRVEE